MTTLAKQVPAAIFALAIGVGSLATVTATPISTFPSSAPLGSTVSVTDVTDWTTQPGETPNEVVQGVFNIAGGTTYSGGVYAGINDLTLSVNGGAAFTTYGFCIDPFHFSVANSTDTTVALSGAPKDPGPMSATAATEIEQLWDHMFSPTMSAYNAAVMQVTIWDLVCVSALQPSPFLTALSTGDATTQNVLEGMTNELEWLTVNTATAPAADLIALTTSPNAGQDYVVQVSVPDETPSYVLLAGAAGLLALGVQKFRGNPSRQIIRSIDR